MIIYFKAIVCYPVNFFVNVSEQQEKKLIKFFLTLNIGQSPNSRVLDSKSI